MQTVAGDAHDRDDLLDGGRVGRQIANRGAAKARVLLFSKAALPSIGVYPDTDTIGVWPDDDTEFYFKRSDAVSREEVV